jgi:hypothetical protein
VESFGVTEKSRLSFEYGGKKPPSNFGGVSGPFKYGGVKVSFLQANNVVIKKMTGKIRNSFLMVLISMTDSQYLLTVALP